MLVVCGIGILLVTVVVNLQLVKKVFNIGTSGYAYESAYQMRELIKNKEDKVLVWGILFIIIVQVLCLMLSILLFLQEAFAMKHSRIV